MLGCDVHGHAERRALPGNTRDVYNTLRVADAGFACLGSRRRIKPARYGQLGSADRMGDIDVQTGVVAYTVGAMRIIFRLRGPGWVPEVAPMGFKDASTWAYLLLSAMEVVIVIEVEIDTRCPRPQTPSQQHQTCS